MSDLEEPPAKVLKIDNIDGVTHVTELSGFPEPFDGVAEEQMGEESGIIEGGADPEQEEWLSEGILTDDDYNPASQEVVDDRTDSQLGTGDEEHLDSTLDSEANMADNDANMGDNDANMGDNDANMGDNDANMADNEAHLDETEANFDETEQQLDDTEQHLDDTDPHLDETGARLDDTQADLEETQEHIDETETHLNDTPVSLNDTQESLNDTEAHLNETEANLYDTQAQLAESEANLDESEANLNDTDASDPHAEASLVESEANLEIVPVSEANGENLMEIELNVSLENGIHTADSEANLTNSEPSMTQDDTVATNNETNVPQTVEQLNEMSNVDTDMVESQTYTQEYVQQEPKAKTGDVSDIIIQRVITLNKNKSPNVKEVESKTVELNIEETMKHLDEKSAKQDDFERFLTKSTVSKGTPKPKQEVTQEQDDGNDTDDLLRMLGEEDGRGKKKLTKTVRDIRAAANNAASSDDDDDDFVYEGASIKTVNAAKTALAKKQAVKAVPEDLDDDEDDDEDDTEMSADESKAMQRMFGFGTSTVKRPQKASAAARPAPTILNLVNRPPDAKPARQYQNRRIFKPNAQSILKPTTPAPKPTKPPLTSMAVRTSFKPPEVKAPAPFKPFPAQQNINKNKEKFTTSQKTKPEPGKLTILPEKIKIEPERKKIEPGKFKIEPERRKIEPEKSTQPRRVKFELGNMRNGSGREKMEPDEIIDEEEFLDDDEFGLDEDEFAESEVDMSEHRQRIRRPERMDEEAPSDAETEPSEDGSLYDELPSSESEDMEDWFSIDIRSEKAGDYIPLLGPKAKELLLEEKRRVSARLSTLKQSHTALIASGKQQAAALRRATATLAELDDMLRAA